MIPNFIFENMSSRPTTPVLDKAVSVVGVRAVDDSDASSLAGSEERIERVSSNPHILHERDAGHALGFSFPGWKKWAIITSVFIVQISMNFNAAIYGNAGEGMAEEFGVSMSTVKVGQMLFLVFYAFGCGKYRCKTHTYGSSADC